MCIFAQVKYGTGSREVCVCVVKGSVYVVEKCVCVVERCVCVCVVERSFPCLVERIECMVGSCGLPASVCVCDSQNPDESCV